MKVKLKNEKKSGHEEGGSAVDGLALGRVMETNHRGNSSNQQTTSQLTQTHTYSGCTHINTHIHRHGNLSIFFCLRSVLLNEHDGFPQRLRGSIKHTQSI